jgi:hypothetical protein
VTDHGLALDPTDRTFGVEVEYGDINLMSFVRYVYRVQHKKMSTWRDRHLWLGGKPQVYDQWNVTSDPTILNSNGTQSMRSVMKTWTEEDERVEELFRELDDASVPAVKVGDRFIHPVIPPYNQTRHLWQGAELVSRVARTSEMETFLSEFEPYATKARHLGAIAEPRLCHGVHVHVGVEDFTLVDMKRMIERSIALQDRHKAFVPLPCDYPTIWWTEDDVQRAFCKDSLRDAFDRCEQAPEGGQSLEMRYGDYRRQVNPSPWFKWKLNEADGIPTVEVRGFPSTFDPDELRTFIEFAVGMVVAAKAAGGHSSGVGLRTET